jgi:hypothetical protein
MSPAAKAKRVRPASAWLRRTTYEDDAEQALKEIAAARGKADQATEARPRRLRSKPKKDRQ